MEFNLKEREKFLKNEKLKYINWIKWVGTNNINVLNKNNFKFLIKNTQKSSFWKSLQFTIISLKKLNNLKIIFIIVLIEILLSNVV